jgi:hypothetical protein
VRLLIICLKRHAEQKSTTTKDLGRQGNGPSTSILVLAHVVVAVTAQQFGLANETLVNGYPVGMPRALCGRTPPGGL